MQSANESETHPSIQLALTARDNRGDELNPLGNRTASNIQDPEFITTTLNEAVPDDTPTQSGHQGFPATTAQGQPLCHPDSSLSSMEWSANERHDGIPENQGQVPDSTPSQYGHRFGPTTAHGQPLDHPESQSSLFDGELSANEGRDEILEIMNRCLTLRLLSMVIVLGQQRRTDSHWTTLNHSLLHLTGN